MAVRAISMMFVQEARQEREGTNRLQLNEFYCINAFVSVSEQPGSDQGNQDLTNSLKSFWTE
ncbi:MAG: hypothetical protein C5B47_04700 [Verrucomicrobia bacterium]|nr:MAG: hypothetical protein C5B47_04700 [Verrucomicrobiota bacterium]